MNAKYAYLVIWLAMLGTTHAQTFTTLFEFNGNNGSGPTNVTLAQGADGKLYGTTGNGSNVYGTAFKISSAGKLTTLYGFVCNSSQCLDGGNPNDGLVLGADGYWYGTTSTGGSSIFNAACDFWGCGSIFKVSPGGNLTNLYSFSSADGLYPNNLLQATNGNFYGTTYSGGANMGGTFFKITANGTLSTLYNFSQNSFPHGVIQATDGNFYGTTNQGGDNSCPGGCGAVFKVNATGDAIALYKFCSQSGCRDGSTPSGGLIQASDDNFYGLTIYGGDDGSGTIFKITATGTLSTVYNFCSVANCADGQYPAGPLLQATDGNLYGSTGFGGDLSCNAPVGCGTIFRVTPGGTLTTLYDFEFPDSGGNGLFQATTGLLYGTTYAGGNLACRVSSSGCGTVFSLDMGLGPFVAFVRSYGKVSQTVAIFGQGFTGTTNVVLNGIPASFKVVSDTYLTATVPSGATTGFVTVTTPSGVLTSNVPFRVIP